MSILNLPVFRATISPEAEDDYEVNCIALVDRPAIQSNFLKFSDDTKPLTFAIQNEEEQIITGLAMVANMPIYRKDKSGEYYVYFDAPTIKTIAEKFFKKQYNLNLNLQHNAKQQAEGVYFFESWIVDRAKGKLPLPEFKDVEDGSWLVSAKVENPQLWQDIKAGKFNGFSVEGLFKMQLNEDLQIEEITDEQFAEDLEFLLQYLKK